MSRQLYIEIHIHADLAELWERTQVPAQHRRWDARFTEIDYLGTTTPQRFRYATRVLPGLLIHGEGVTAGERTRPDGSATSALRFRSDHPLSMIVKGSGYWRYVPTAHGIRFLTGYDYVPRWHIADHMFRPLLGWATAWSFDRLRIWLEHGVPPETTRRLAIADAAIRAGAIALAIRLKHPLPALIALLPRPDRIPSAGRCHRKKPPS